MANIPDRSARWIDFGAVNEAAFAVLLSLCFRWLPTGKRTGHWWLACNPTRQDRHPSLGVNLQTGSWKDFATGDGGGDPISLTAYLAGTTQYEAASQLAAMLEVRHG